MTTLPARFAGCIFDDGWEFDAPCVIYSPWKYRRFGIGGNSSTLESLVEDIIYRIWRGEEPHDGGLDKECAWRGWGLRGFRMRRRAEHVVFTVQWAMDDERPWGDVVERAESWGPPALGRQG